MALHLHNCQSNTWMDKLLSLIFRLGMHHLLVGQEGYVQSYTCHISIWLEGCVQDVKTHIGGLRFNYKGFKANLLVHIVLTKKVLEKGLAHHRGYTRTTLFWLGCFFSKLSSNWVSDQLIFCRGKKFGVCVWFILYSAILFVSCVRYFCPSPRQNCPPDKETTSNE